MASSRLSAARWAIGWLPYHIAAIYVITLAPRVHGGQTIPYWYRARNNFFVCAIIRSICYSGVFISVQINTNNDERISKYLRVCIIVLCVQRESWRKSNAEHSITQDPQSTDGTAICNTYVKQRNTSTPIETYIIQSKYINRTFLVGLNSIFVAMLLSQCGAQNAK